jgi:hypothetical protein
LAVTSVCKSPIDEPCAVYIIKEIVQKHQKYGIILYVKWWFGLFFGVCGG